MSARKPEAISIERILGFNQIEINKFIDNLEEVMPKHSLGPADIYKVDETGLTRVHKTEKILAPVFSKGQKRVGSLISWERGKTITIICCLTASGNFIPPLFIYPR